MIEVTHKLQQYSILSEKFKNFFNDIKGLYPDYKVLDDLFLKERFSNKFEFGILIQEKYCKYILLTNYGFPFSNLDIALFDTPILSKYPHVEQSGKLCLGDLTFSFPISKRHITELISCANEFYEKFIHNLNRDDFLEEIQTYWLLEEKTPFENLVFLENIKESRFVLLYREKNRNHNIIVEIGAKNKNQIEVNLNIEFNQKALVVMLNNPLYPCDFPSDVSSLCSLVIANCNKNLLNIEIKSTSFVNYLNIIFSYEYNNHMYYLGARIKLPAVSSLCRGFRKDHLNLNIMLINIIKNQKCYSKSFTSFIDYNSLIKRSSGVNNLKNANYHIGIVGCGALGSLIADMLLKSGIRKLTLIDPDILGWHNLGRHLLGSEYVNYNKAKALSLYLLRKFPDANVHSIDKKVQYLHHQNPKELEKFDLLLSATGDWSTDGFIEQLVTRGELVSGLFTWVESFGVAGHACFVNGDVPRLSLFSNDFGKPNCKVISDDNSIKIRKEPFCGGEYQEFGAVNLSSIASMASRFTLEILNSEHVGNCWRVWISPKRDFCDNSISISKFWYDKPNNLFDCTHSLSDAELS